MQKEEVMNKILKVFDSCGIEWKNDEINIDSIDSFNYISTLVELENEFNIDFPEQFLVDNIFSSLEGLTNIIFDLINEK